MEVVALLYESCELLEFIGHGVWHGEEILHVIVVLDPSAELLHVFGVIGIVVDGGHGAELVEAHDEHALGVEVSEAERTHHGGHALAAPPLLNGIEEGAAYLDVVDEINPSEAYILLLPALVGAVVDDGGYAASYLSVLIGEEVFGLAEVKSHVAVAPQRVHVVHEQGWGVIGVAFV